MIKEILIKNFEVHKYFRAKLDPYVTTFTGATDMGKSSIIRALEWVALNRVDGRLGDDFICDPEKPAFVGIKTDKGIVSRKRGKDINIYKISGLKDPLEGFGTHVPEEVQQFLNMNELNFQFQFDAPYWFFISPGEVSRQLNKIVDLDIIDTSLSKLNKQVRDSTTKVKLSKEELKEIKEKEKQLAFVKPMTKEYYELESLETSIENQQAYYNSMAVSIKDVEKYVNKAGTLSMAHSEARMVLKIGNKYRKKSYQAKSLTNIIESLEKALFISEAKIPNINPLIILAKKWNQTKKKKEKLSKCINEIEMEQKKLCQRKKELSSKERKLKKMIGQTCPLCGNLVKTK